MATCSNHGNHINGALKAGFISWGLTVIFSLPDSYKGKYCSIPPLVYNALLQYSFYIELCVNNVESYCKHLHMYRCVYSNNNKEQIRWDI